MRFPGPVRAVEKQPTPGGPGIFPAAFEGPGEFLRRRLEILKCAWPIFRRDAGLPQVVIEVVFDVLKMVQARLL